MFPVVAIGASSGGLEAVTGVFKHLPANTGMAFIFVQHLSADHKSNLVALLAKTTKMPVHEIVNMERMISNHVYVIPNNKGIRVVDGHIQLVPRPKSSPNRTIDVLFHSLAETHKEKAIAIVLSGNASDGTSGLKSIKEQGGITFAQDNSAKYPSMPQSAINSGVADFVLSPKEIALRLVRVAKYAFGEDSIVPLGLETVIADDDADLKTILTVLHTQTGVDFSNYKKGTLKRRIQRRMILNKASSLKHYIKLFKSSVPESTSLFNDFLINVTEFFRDTEAFEHIKTDLLPKILAEKGKDSKVRIWVTACSTGQEVYSLGILLVELLGDKLAEKQVQIFASDLSEQAIKKARSGIYTPQEVETISPKRLKRFFVKVGDNYCIIKSVRDLCAFAPHNILSDPPFSNIDFISCRNLLIYLDKPMQKRVFNTFHYALNNNGYLLLGKSETTGSSSQFSKANERLRIYSRKPGARILPELSMAGLVPKVKSRADGMLSGIDSLVGRQSLETSIDAVIIPRFLPAYVVINDALDILQFKGPTNLYLQQPAGKPTFNILKMALPEIAFELRSAIYKAMETKGEVHKTDIEVKRETVLKVISINVIPIQAETLDAMLLVVFTEHGEKDDVIAEAGKGTPADKRLVAKLKRELAGVHAQLVLLDEERHQAMTNLQTANEGRLASNEEFQSMNEEMATSKEELESTNEELITTNHELVSRNEQLADAYNFSESIISTLHEPMLVMNKDMIVKSCNSAFCKKFLVQQSETEGKPLYGLGNGQWDIAALRQLLMNVVQKDKSFYDHEITANFPDIGVKTMLLNARKVVQKAHNEQLILLAFTDITQMNLQREVEKKKLENIITERTKALAEQNTVLQKMNKELETFSFISSHDLQEPLRKIKNFAKALVLQEAAHLSPQGKEYLERMEVSVKRMQSLIDDLLAYSRVKHAVSKLEKTNLNKLLQEIKDDFKEQLKEKKAIINVSDLCEVEVVRVQFRQLLYNLVSNSIKFSDKSRPLRITLKSGIKVGRELKNETLLPDTKYCHITYVDNGIGFDPQYKDRIFEVFQRLNEYEEYVGTGMGLSICKRIIETHQGAITATGTVNKGARFDIFIPA